MDELIVTERERKQILAGAFAQLQPPRLKAFPAKYKKKLVVMEYLAELFEEGRIYTQKEVTDLLLEVYKDPLLLRREMVDAGYLCRPKDGSAYWRGTPDKT